MPHQCYYRGDVRIRVASDRALLVTFGEEISAPSHMAVRGLTAALAGARGVLNLHPAFASVLVEFDPRRHTHAEMEALVRAAIEDATEQALPPSRLIEIPVRYGGEFGPDLADVARRLTATGRLPEPAPRPAFRRTRRSKPRRAVARFGCI